MKRSATTFTFSAAVRRFGAAFSLLIVTALTSPLPLDAQTAPEPLPSRPKVNQPKSNRAQQEGAARQQELMRIARIARQAETEGDYERAIELWQSLRRLDPGYFSAYYGLRKCFAAAEKWEEGLAFLNEMMRLSNERKVSIDYLTIAVDRVEMLHQASRAAEAEQETLKLLKTHAHEQRIYNQLSNMLVGLNRVDDAVALLRRGRTILNNPTGFAWDIARWEEARMNYRAAAEEYLLYLRESPDRHEYVVGALGDIAAADNSEQTVLEVVNHSYKTAQGQYREQLSQLLAALHFRARRYREAFELYRQIDAGKGSELLNFARTAAAEGEWSLAAEAYREVASGNRSNEVLSEAMVGLASVLEKAGHIDSARTVYEQITIGKRTAEAQFTANYRLGMIAAEADDDPIKARDYFSRALALAGKANAPNYQLDELRLEHAMTWARQGDFDRAAENLRRMLKQMPPIRYSPASTARWLIVRLQLWRGDISGMTSEINALIAADPASIYANEALELQSAAFDLKGQPELMKFIGTADYNKYRGRFDRSRDDYLALLSSSTMNSAREFASWQLYRIYNSRDQLSDALGSLENLIRLEGAMKRDQALLAASVVSEKLGDNLKAVGYLERLLLDHPDSPIADKARRRLRELSAGIL